MTKKEAIKERMRKKMEANKNAHCVFEKVSAETENYVYRVPGAETQARSSAQQKLDDDKLIAEFEKPSTDKIKNKDKSKESKKKDKSKKIK
jgi:hypothetical protein